MFPCCWKCDAAMLMPDAEGPFLSVTGERTRLEGCREEYRIHSYEEAKNLCPLLESTAAASEEKEKPDGDA